MGSILHELNCDRPMPSMTTTNIGNHVGNSGNDEHIDIVCGKGVDTKTETCSEDDKRSAESEAISNEDEDSCTLSPITRGEHYSVIAAVREVVFHLLDKALLALALLFLLDICNRATIIT